MCRSYVADDGTCYYQRDTDSSGDVDDIPSWQRNSKHDIVDSHDRIQVQDTGFTNTFLHAMTLNIPWRRLSTDECFSLSPAFPMASADALSRQLSKVNLPEQMPPELFTGVLFYLDEARSAEDFHRWMYTRYLRRRGHNEHQGGDTLGSLRAGSLVCRYWANQCRRSMFLDSVLCINSSDDLDAILSYARDGCPSLVPIYMHIGGLVVTQTYDASHSFLHRLHYITQLNSKRGESKIELKALSLSGPIPDRLPHHNRGTPHWSVPPTIPTPPSILSFADIEVANIHLPSLKHVVKYVRHLTHAVSAVYFDKLTWDQSTAALVFSSIPLARTPRVPVPSDPAINYVDTNVHARGCTENLRLCLYSALVRPDCPLHWLPDVRTAFRLMESLWKLYFAEDSANEECRLIWGEYTDIDFLFNDFSQ